MLVNIRSFCHTHQIATVATGVSLTVFMMVVFQLDEFWPLEGFVVTGWYV